MIILRIIADGFVHDLVGNPRAPDIKIPPRNPSNDNQYTTGKILFDLHMVTNLTRLQWCRIVNNKNL